MKHLGDITKINGLEIPVPDCVIGGSPCQDLSVAGKRAGLDGERSGLFMEQIRVVKELREHDIRDGRTDVLIRPRWMVWENVPGALSSGTPKGEDFRIVLEEIAKVKDPNAVIPRPQNGKWTNSGAVMGDGWSIAWRILDAQYWGPTYFDDEGVPTRLGTPQRRRRIALVADFNGGYAPEILFERESLSGHLETSGDEGQGTAGDSEESVGEPSYTLKIRGGREVDSFGKRAGKGALVQTERSATLAASQDQTLITPELSTWSVDEKMGQTYVNKELANTLASRDYKQPQAVNETIAYGISAYDSNSMRSDNPHSGVYEADTARTLDNNGGTPACNQGGMAIVEPTHTHTPHSPRRDSLNGTKTIQACPSEPQAEATAVARRPLLYQTKVGTLCADDLKGPNRQYVEDEKVIVEHACGFGDNADTCYGKGN